MSAKAKEPAPKSAEVAAELRERGGPEQVLDQVLRMIRALRKRQDEIAQRRGLTLLQYSVIRLLRKEGTLNLTELSKRLRLKHSTVSKLVDRMERDRLLIRVKSTEDKRSYNLRLTERALEQVEGLSLSVTDFSMRLMGYLTPEEQGQLLRIIAKLTGGFKKELERLSKQNESA